MARNGMQFWGCAAALFLAASALSGCAEYMDRKDTIAFSAGEAQNKNIIAHTRDPWPVAAANTTIVTSGNRAARAVRNYECGTIASSGGSAGAKGGSANSISINMGNAPSAPSGPCPQ